MISESRHWKTRRRLDVHQAVCLPLLDREGCQRERFLIPDDSLYAPPDRQTAKRTTRQEVLHESTTHPWRGWACGRYLQARLISLSHQPSG